MAAKYYLDQEGLERLVNYIQDELGNKLDKDAQVTLPEDLVYEADLEDYAKKSDIPEGQDLSDYARVADLDNYALASALDDYATLDALDDYATNDDLESLRGEVTGVYHFRGSVADLAALQEIQDPAEGDVYNLEDTGMNAAWTGEAWDEFGSVVDLSDYMLSEDVQPMSIPTVDSILYGGKRAIVSDIAGLKAMIANDEDEVDVVLSDDVILTEAVIVPEGKTLNLDLGGNSLGASGVALAVSGGEAVITNGSVASSNSDAIVVNNGGTVTIDGADITSSRSNAISAREGDIIVNSGNIQSQEAGLLGLKDSTITINGGTITGIDNGPVMGNGSAAGSANDGTNCNIVMNGGTLIAHIQSAGYIACGVYVPNSGSFTMNGGEIISDGCGICMRGGQVNIGANAKITANGATGVTGKVGDSRVVVGPYAIVYDANSKYPAVNTLELNIADGAQLVGTDGDIDVLLAEGYTANINDNRT